MTCFLMFQSALLAFARSDSIICSSSFAGLRFQSALLAFARSDPGEVADDALESVSIRAPCFRKERCLGLPLITPEREFQSALLAFARSDGPFRARDNDLCCFNPRSLLSQGAIAADRSGEREGEVSIRAPCFRKERSLLSTALFTASLFQSALLAFARSDSHAGRDCPPLPAVSIRAPRFRK